MNPIHAAFQAFCKKGYNSLNKWWILPLIELDLYFMNIHLCIKYESNTLIFSKDNERKPFSICKGCKTFLFFSLI